MARFLKTIVPLAAFAAAFLLTRWTGTETTGTAPERSGAMEALEFWSGARAYPAADIPPDKYYRAFESARKSALKQRPLPFTGSGWSYIGPSNLAGRTLAIALNPMNPNTIYAGSAAGGLWRSYTGGVDGDWKRVPTGYPVLGVASIAIDPADSNVMYIGTGEVYRYAGTAGGLMVRTTRGSYGMGILKTTDGGSTWTKSLDWSYNQERGVQAIRFNPLNPGSVWAATTEGIYKSTDAGSTWENVLQMLMGEDIVIHPVDTLKVLVSTGNLGIYNAMLKTVDGGSGWSLATPVDFTGKALLGACASDPDMVYASVADSTTGVGSLWRTTDFGDSWTKQSDNTTNAIFQVQGWYSHFVAVDPVNSSILIHAGVPASRSTDGGVTFSGVGGTYSDHHAYAWDLSDPSIVYIANDDGVYRSTNAGTSFVHVSDNLGTGQFYNGFSNSASDSLIALGQVQDHIPGYLFNGSPVWPASAADEVGWTAIDQSNDFVMYAGTRDGGGVRKSTNRGLSFGGTGGSFTGAACWNSPFVVSPSNPNVIYFGRSRVYKSTAAGAGWAATNGGAELDGNPALSMAVAPSNPDVVFVGTAPLIGRTHVFATSNGGTGWSDVTGPLPDRYPLDLAVDPANPSVAYVGYGGYGTGHVFKTTNGGGSWTDLTGSLPDIPVTALLVDPANTSVVYLGSDLGVYISTNGGGSWEPFGEGLPEAVLVADLSMTASNRTLRAATHGNSVFERKMPSAFPAISSVVPDGGESFQVGSSQVISWTQSLVSSVKLELSTDDGSTWSTIAASVPAWPDSFAWTVPPTITTAARVRVSSTADTLLSAQSAAAFSIEFDGVILDLADDWNLLSLPMLVPDPSKSVVFPGAVSSAWRYAGGYLVAESLAAGSGYWLKFPSPSFLPFSGDSLTAESLAVTKGWQLVGSLSAPVPAAAVATDPPGLIETPFYSYDGGYSADDTLRPGRGYWVKTSGSGSIVLDAGAAQSPLAAGAAQPGLTTGGPPDANGDAFGTVTFTDARGRSATLRVSARGSIDAASPELPPVPPQGAFDVRFDGGLSGPGRGAGDDGARAILVQGVAWPAVVSWNIPGEGSYALSPGAAGPREILLSGSGSVELASTQAFWLRRVVPGDGNLPVSLSLEQNYPNPFNPGTRIGFVIPAGGTADGGTVPVSLRVYDIGGRAVATLAAQGMAPGAHELEWNAGDLPGGVYFCVLKTGVESRTVKMLLLK
jgi:hypothetical protein